MPVAASLDPRAEQKLMAADQAPERRQGARPCARRRPRDLRGDRAPARRQGIRDTGQAGQRLGGLRRRRHPARPVHHAFRRPRGDAAAPEAALRHPFLHRRRQHHRAPHRWQGRSRFRAGGTGVAAAIGGQAADRTDGDHRDRAPRTERPARKGLQPRSAGPLFPCRPRHGGCEICCNAPEWRRNPRFLDFRGQNLSFRPNRR